MRLLFAACLLSLLANDVWAAGDRGKVIFDRFCMSCHGSDGAGNEALGAPSIAGLPQWYIDVQIHKFKDGARGLHQRDVPGMRMRPMALTLKTDEDVASVAAHVAGLPRPSLKAVVIGSAVRGEERYKVCAACHGADAKGNQQLNAPPLVGGSDWYLVTQLHNFKDGLRGGDPAKDPNGAAMRGMAATLDEQGVKDVVAYINVLGP